METVRMTTTQAIVEWLVNRYTVVDGDEVPLFAGAFGIFGHGNVTCLAEALEPAQDCLPTWRGHNEQSMAPAAWLDAARDHIAGWHRYLDSWKARDVEGKPAYAEVIQVINELCDDDYYCLSAACRRRAACPVNWPWDGGASPCVASTPSSATRRWATRSPVPGEPRWPGREATLSPGWATDRT